MKKIIFGAGMIGKKALLSYTQEGIEVECFIDNNSEMWGRSIRGVTIWGINKLKEFSNYELILACNEKNRIEIEKQLHNEGIENFSLFKIPTRKKIFSYSHPHDKEDIILYDVFRNEKKIFYIDVGANDPEHCSVTKLLYMHGARGINIEPQKDMYELLCADRERDINLCIGAGSKHGEKKLYVQGGLSTVVENNITAGFKEESNIEIWTLEEICDKYLPYASTQIDILKIDVEGFEKDVLLGANFKKYRPKVIVMESTYPCTMDFCHEQWENILTSNNYHFIYTYGVNRYYVADEAVYLDRRFLPMEDIYDIYDIYEFTKSKL